MIPERNIKFDFIDTCCDKNIFSISYSKERGSDLKFYNDKFIWMLPSNPSWDDITFFLESRVMSKRDSSNEELEMLGLKKWDIFKILSKTKGKMFGDNFEMRNMVGFDV